MTRNKVEFAHKLTVIYNWAMNPDKDTISSLTEKQAKELSYKIGEMWGIIERRGKHD